MITDSDKTHPLVSAIMLTHNCGRFLPEALLGVFAQTYRPLEIIVSDDNSSDNSFDIINEFIAGRKDCDVKVIVNRNKRNLGCIGNWQRSCELAHGELLVKVDGDDYSSPIRIEEFVNAWVKDGKRAKIIMCYGVKVDMAGQKCVGFIKRSIDDDLVMGAVAAYSVDTYIRFPHIANSGAYDDQIYTNRALMLGVPLIIPKILVKYRTGSGMTSSRQIDYRAPTIRVLKSEIDAYTQLLIDLEYIKNCLPVERYSEFKMGFSQKLNQCKNSLLLWSGKTFAERWQGFISTLPKHRWSMSNVASLVALIPNWLSDNIFFTWQKFRDWKVRKKYKQQDPNELLLR